MSLGIYSIKRKKWFTGFNTLKQPLWHTKKSYAKSFETRLYAETQVALLITFNL